MRKVPGMLVFVFTAAVLLTLPCLASRKESVQ